MLVYEQGNIAVAFYGDTDKTKSGMCPCTVLRSTLPGRIVVKWLDADHLPEQLVTKDKLFAYNYAHASGAMPIHQSGRMHFVNCMNAIENCTRMHKMKRKKEREHQQQFMVVLTACAALSADAYLPYDAFERIALLLWS